MGTQYMNGAMTLNSNQPKKGVHLVKRLFNFKCESGEVYERYCCSEIKVATCKCGKEAKRQMSAPRYFDNTTGKSPARH